MEMKTFDKQDWESFSGADEWVNHEPLIGEGELCNGTKFVLVLARNGAFLTLGIEEEMSKAYTLDRVFPTDEDAQNFACEFGQLKTLDEVINTGFHEV